MGALLTLCKHPPTDAPETTSFADSAEQSSRGLSDGRRRGVNAHDDEHSGNGGGYSRQQPQQQPPARRGGGGGNRRQSVGGQDDWISLSGRNNVDLLGNLRGLDEGGAQVKSKVEAMGISFRVCSFQSRCQIGLAIGLGRSQHQSVYAQKYFSLACDEEGVVYAGLGIFTNDNDRRCSANLGDQLAIEYDGSSIVYKLNDREIHVHKFVLPAGEELFAHASIFEQGGEMTELVYLKDDW